VTTGRPVGVPVGVPVGGGRPDPAARPRCPTRPPDPAARSGRAAR